MTRTVSLLRLVSAVPIEISEEWETGKTYLTMETSTLAHGCQSAFQNPQWSAPGYTPSGPIATCQLFPSCVSTDPAFPGSPATGLALQPRHGPRYRARSGAALCASIKAWFSFTKPWVTLRGHASEPPVELNVFLARACVSAAAFPSRPECNPGLNQASINVGITGRAEGLS